MCRRIALLLSISIVAAVAYEPIATAQHGDQERRSDWAFQAVAHPQIPAIRGSALVRTPIDAFVLDRLERGQLTFAPPAGKRELLRRAKFDLLGLPPTPEELDEFLADEAPDAYERLIDRLLDNPHYGETWGRHWLDLVRFAETAGFNADPIRPLAYKYRDYVVRAFNRDTTYDRFVQEQLAGDELFPDDAESLLATGYTRMWPDESNASNILQSRQEAFNDLTTNVGSVFLGLSLGCAQCHNHKFDPILQSDFYRLQAFFVGLVPHDKTPVGTNEQLNDYQNRLESWQAEAESTRTELHQIEQTARLKAGDVRRMKFPAPVLEAIDTEPDKRTAYQQQLVFWSERQIDIAEKQLLAELSDAQKRRRTELQKQVADLVARRPSPPQELEAMVAAELPSDVPETHLLAGGAYDKPVRTVQPGFLSVITGSADEPAVLTPPRAGASGRRTALAAWLTDSKHPLTARVIVNRIWQGHFGRGLVENANDFGTQTKPPSHPELLDWLASEFVANGWSIKALHRLIMSSQVYRQATVYRDPTRQPGLAESTDQENILYWHYPRRRLTAEATRDALLETAGRLNLQMFGPGVRPELPPGYTTREAWEVSKEESQRDRRAVYVFAKRNLPYPLLEAFDLPDMHESCARRSITTTAPQALMLLNSDMILRFARDFANRLLVANPGGDTRTIIRQGYRLAFTREPSDREIDAAEAFIAQQRDLIAERRQAGERIEVPQAWAKFSDPARAAAIVDFCHSLLNANEFVYID